MNGRESTTGAFGVQHQQLLAEGQVFEDKILARAEDDDDPTDQVPEEGDPGPRILSHSLKWETWKSFVSRLLEVLRRHKASALSRQRPRRHCVFLFARIHRSDKVSGARTNALDERIDRYQGIG